VSGIGDTNLTIDDTESYFRPIGNHVHDQDGFRQRFAYKTDPDLGSVWVS
jgi:hypothetical protein